MANPYAEQSPGSARHPDDSGNRKTLPEVTLPEVTLPGVTLQETVRQVQIITFALIQGVILFVVVALFVSGAALDGQPEVLTWIAVGVAALALINHAVIPMLVVRTQLSHLTSEELRQLSSEQQLGLVLPAFATGHIIACAILEGAAFLAVIAYLIEHSWISLAVSGVMLLLIAARFPTAAGMQYSAENKLREIQLS